MQAMLDEKDPSNFPVSIILLYQEAKEMFAAFDTDGTGSIGFDEFLAKLRVSEICQIVASCQRRPSVHTEIDQHLELLRPISTSFAICRSQIQNTHDFYTNLKKYFSQYWVK